MRWIIFMAMVLAAACAPPTKVSLYETSYICPDPDPSVLNCQVRP